MPPLALGGARPCAKGKGSGGFCCQVPPNPACRSLTRHDCRSVCQTALRSLSHRTIAVVGNYENGPIRAEPCRAKARLLRPRGSYFGPATTHPALLVWVLVEPPGTAPGSDGFITTAIYRHSR